MTPAAQVMLGERLIGHVGPVFLGIESVAVSERQRDVGIGDGEGGVFQTQRNEQARMDFILDRVVSDGFDDQAEQQVIGVAVIPFGCQAGRAADLATAVAMSCCGV